ncbi:MAG: hypothetical protein OXC95_04035 [Dehalococcoidia bacterium]|nr:hypothetical protein [Dehalococcoidia bacterium]
MTVGIVSNHGNWFTSDDHNKELKVLAQSYDWLLFLTDEGLVQFIYDLLLHPDSDHEDAKDAFMNSYSGVRGGNRFTKISMDLKADMAIRIYFEKNLSDIENWFNVISPNRQSISELKDELDTLVSKDWQEILK